MKTQRILILVGLGLTLVFFPQNAAAALMVVGVFLVGLNLWTAAQLQQARDEFHESEEWGLVSWRCCSIRRIWLACLRCWRLCARRRPCWRKCITA